MKGFIVSLILFIVIIILVVLNFFYVQRATDVMKSLAKAVIEESSDTAMSELKSYWKKHMEIVSLSANFRETDKISEELLRFEQAYKYGNELSLMQSYAILCDALEDVARYEQLSLGAIF